MNNLIILFVVIIFQTFLLTIVLLFILFLLSALVSIARGAPYVPVSKKSIKEILSFGELSNRDILYDLGCGDGRVLISGALDFGVSKAIGCEVALWPYLKTLFLIKYDRLSNIEITRQNCLKVSIDQATFIYIYLFPKLVDKIAYKITREARPETRILSVAFPIDISRHVELQLLKSIEFDDMMLYLYELKVPA